MSTEKRPTGGGWKRLPVRMPGVGARSQASVWQRGAVRVISELALMELPAANGAVGPTWLVSVSRACGRPNPRDVQRALRDFGMKGAEEDNHHPGVARHFFLPVDPAHRGVCECKATDTVVTDADGYTWTTPTRGGCSGCELQQLTGRPCPLHAASAPAAAP